MASTANIVNATEPSKNQSLPSAFANYLDSKLANGRHRPHPIKQLGIEKTLTLLSDAWIQQFSPKELERKYKLGYMSIYRMLQDLEPMKQEILAYIQAEEIKPRNFRAFESVQNWENQIRLSGHLSQLYLLSTFENICAGVSKRRSGKQSQWNLDFRCNPDKFDLAKAQEFIAAYLKKYQTKTVPRHLIMAIRHFLASKSIVIPRGFGAQFGLSGEKIGYGKARFVKATDEEIERVRAALKGDLEALTFFDWGIESLARMQTLIKTRNQFRDEENIITTVMHETKTNRDFQKILPLDIPHCYDTWLEIQALSIGRQYIFFDSELTKDVSRFADRMSKRLKAAYKQAGITEPYAYKKPFHFLRHTGAHLWLMRTDYDYGLVAELGWDDINTLRDCYGGLPPEVFRRKITQLKKA